jgi:hypothetical protein
MQQLRRANLQGAEESDGVSMLLTKDANSPWESRNFRRKRGTVKVEMAKCCFPSIPSEIWKASTSSRRWEC